MIVGLIGAGNMGGALVKGWAAAETGPDTILISDADESRARALADTVGGRRAASNMELAEDADVIVLAMKPAALQPVAEEIRVVVSDRGLPLVSILGATTIARIEDAFGSGTPILRFMPNVAAEIRAGTFCYATSKSLDDVVGQRLLDLFGLLGELVAIEDRLMDAATAIAGSGPAFYSLVVEALVDAGVKEGLSARDASRLAVSTMSGTALLLEHYGDDAATLRGKVTSPGGMTAAGLAALEQSKTRAAFAAAVAAVIRRAAEFHQPGGDS
jgi:pyrroline-5-carboxylate reductase